MTKEKANYNAKYALADMVLQFGYATTFRGKQAVFDGGLSALESAFSALLECGCKTTSNGKIKVEDLLEFMEQMDKARRGE